MKQTLLKQYILKLKCPECWQEILEETSVKVDSGETRICPHCQEEFYI